MNLKSEYRPNVLLGIEKNPGIKLQEAFLNKSRATGCK